MTPDIERLEALLEKATAIQARVASGNLDLRPIGEALEGKWDQDFIAALLTGPATIRTQQARIDALEAGLRDLEPYLDAIVCFASDMGEHEPNRLAFNARALLEGYTK